MTDNTSLLAVIQKFFENDLSAAAGILESMPEEEAAGALRLQRTDPVSPAEEVERRETQERVREVLSRMEPRKARLLLLRHTGHSYAEIADILGVAPGSVGTMLARAERDFARRYRALEERS